jgi:hypothetical protein
MGLLLVKEDFVGKYNLVKSDFDQIDSFIDQFEEPLLRELLGKELFDLFKADVDPITLKPVTQIYLDLYDPLEIEWGACPHTYQSLGLKNTLLGIIWFEYVRNDPKKQSMNGTVVNKTETSEQANLTFIYRNYNESIESFNIIWRYTEQDKTNYPTFNGHWKRKASWV